MSAAKTGVSSGLGVRALLGTERIRLGVPCENWRDAVRAVGALMVQTGTAEQRYVDAMITSAEKLGPYIVIAPGLAMPHSAPEDGALRSSLALITLAEPVEFGHPLNDPVSVVLALSAVSRGNHLEQLSEVSRSLQSLFDDSGGWARLLEARTPDDALDILASDSNPTERTAADR